MKSNNQKRKTVYKEQRERLLKWFTMRQIESKLSLSNEEENFDPDIRFESSALPLYRPFDNNVEVGQIRIMNPNFVPKLMRPLYYAVIDSFTDDLMLIAPFSTFSEPATTGEWLTGFKDIFLSVLQLWNARTVPEVFLKQGWVAGNLNKKQLSDARKVFAHICTGKKISPELQRKIGLPIINTADPRIKYQQEESNILSELTEKTFNYLKKREIISTINSENFKKILSPLNQYLYAASDLAENYSNIVFIPIEKATNYDSLLAQLRETKIEPVIKAKCSSFIPKISKISDLVWKISEIPVEKEEIIPFLLISLQDYSKLAVGIISKHNSDYIAQVSQTFNERKHSLNSLNEILLIAFL